MNRESRAGVGMTSARTRERLIGRLREQGIRDEETLAAMSAVPRHLFVDEALATRAYEDTALPIGQGQTISQPYIVGRMTAALRTSGPLERVLEVGTGSGYQAAVLSHLAKQVYTVERIADLARAARRRFQALHLTNITVRHADGCEGWPQEAPFDAIMVTAAARTVPEAFFGQLKEGGRLVVPVGADGQALFLYRRRGTAMTVERLEAVNFVPLLPGSLV
ncbi:protein-L-isoaspartate(D-aspartate) O-methyltransferase [Acidiferrobacter sp.]|uniref:protein-L-isoaspartate(D-aspartate) O-methyltransferase n=1 Tax=Acidiferrobacter sp. TaxID=1872107 RepID=UPI002635407A|nr:protein-L-isoaspartate(D-aspartate) O-methyltransferase [Acidiferrobacter sp.]